MIFQEPMTSLNPVFTIERQLTDGLMRLHHGLAAGGARKRRWSLLKSVRIPEPERRLKQYPHELSGGMRQRVVIAMAMACEPRLLIADEPTTALDVTIQAEILALIDRLKRENGMAVLFITHDMAVVAQMADRVVVMYRGDMVEEAAGRADLRQSRRRITPQALLAAVPRLGAMRGKPAPEPHAVLGGDDRAPQPLAPPQSAAGKPLLEVKNLTTRFPVRGGALRCDSRQRPRGRGRQLRARRWRDPVAGRRIRLRQVDLRPLDPAAGRSRTSGADLARRQGRAAN